MNAGMSSVAGDPHSEKCDGFMGSAFGQLLI
jgi:hypothetical protein